MCWQLLLPLRHGSVPGNVNWTEEGHLYAWHMKLRSKSGRARFIVTDNAETSINIPTRYIKKWQARKMAARPDMIINSSTIWAIVAAEGIKVSSIRVDAGFPETPEAGSA